MRQEAMLMKDQVLNPLGWIAFSAFTAMTSVTAHSACMPEDQVGRFIVEQETVVCVSVTVTSDLWPPTVAEPREPKLSGFLANQFRNQFSAIGKLGKPTRFRTNDNDLDPTCNSSEALYVNVKYRAGALERNIVTETNIVFDKKIWSALVVRDINQEMQRGTLTITGGKDPVRTAIFDDLRRIASQAVKEVIVAN